MTKNQIWRQTFSYLLFIQIILYGRECSAQARVVPIGMCPAITGGTCPDPGIRFILFTRSTPENGVQIGGESLPGQFDVSHPTKVLMHGFNEGITVLFRVRDAYLQKGDYNIVMVDWNKYGKNPCYPVARSNAWFAGKCSAHMIKRLVEAGVKDIHAIGVSLGAHVVGYAANELKPYKLPRITGLDPASPLFELASNEHKLDSSDAEFVDVIHTNALVQGKAERLGHVDFYMNGGTHQPGCTFVAKPLTCDHLRSVAYFAESIVSEDGFWAWKCSGQAQYALGQCPQKGEPVLVGEFVDKSARGFYVTKTRSQSPFAVGRWDTKVSSR
ncbi:lipase member H [Anabrus simplex]|uniref:lipase member H n=1 Tax=Anabrus simplex TaxID=316456 RepID=UPI0035A30B7A